MGNFSLKAVSPAFILALANFYLSNESFTFEKLGTYFGIDPKAVSSILYRGISEDIIPDMQAVQIYSKVVYCNSKHQDDRAKRWEKAFEQRNKLRARKAQEKRA